MAEQAGFVSAVSNVFGVIQPDERSELYALPRIGWDARRSLRTLRVRLSGLRLGR